MSLSKLNVRKLIASFFVRYKPLRFKKGEIILRPDNLNPGVNFIERGHIKVYSITEDGSEKIHIVFGPNELFPLLWVFKNIMRDIYYEALDDVILRKSTKEDFLNFIKGSVSALLELVDELLTMTNVFVGRVDDLEYVTSYPRLVSRLISLSERFGRKSGKHLIIDVPMTQRDIAASINMTRETASRDMELLIKKKIIKYEKHLIVVLDMLKLKRELDESSFGEKL